MCLEANALCLARKKKVHIFLVRNEVFAVHFKQLCCQMEGNLNYTKLNLSKISSALTQPGTEG